MDVRRLYYCIVLVHILQKMERGGREEYQGGSGRIQAGKRMRPPAEDDQHETTTSTT